MRRLTWILPMLAIVIGVVGIFACAAGEDVFAQEKDSPALTDVQKLQIQNVAQRMEIAQLRAQQAQRDFESARAEAEKLIASLQVQGYTLDLQTMTYQAVPKPAELPKEPKK